MPNTYRATAAWERTVPEQTLRWGINVLFRHPPHILAAGRAALTPGPSPALRERGELVSGLGIVARRGRRIVTATLTSLLFRFLGGNGKGPGEGEGGPHPQPLSRSAGEGCVG